MGPKMTTARTWDDWDCFGEQEQRVVRVVLCKFRELEAQHLVAPSYMWNVVPAHPRYHNPERTTAEDFLAQINSQMWGPQAHYQYWQVQQAYEAFVESIRRCQPHP